MILVPIYSLKMLWFLTQLLGSQLAAKTHQIQSPGSHFFQKFPGRGGAYPQTLLEQHALHTVYFTCGNITISRKVSPLQQKILYETLNLILYSDWLCITLLFNRASVQYSPVLHSSQHSSGLWCFSDCLNNPQQVPNQMRLAKVDL